MSPGVQAECYLEKKAIKITPGMVKLGLMSTARRRRKKLWRKVSSTLKQLNLNNQMLGINPLKGAQPVIRLTQF